MVGILCGNIDVSIFPARLVSMYSKIDPVCHHCHGKSIYIFCSVLFCFTLLFAMLFESLPKKIHVEDDILQDNVQQKMTQ